MFHIYHGDGKGKTTAAIGLAVRASGAGKRVIFAQFMKGNVSSEIGALESFRNIRVKIVGKQFGFFKDMTEAQKMEITERHNALLQDISDAVQSGLADVVILDEMCSAYQYGLVDRNQVEKLIARAAGAEIELIITGRGPQESWKDKADYITCMAKEKHPYDAGVLARKGIEF